MRANRILKLAVAYTLAAASGMALAQTPPAATNTTELETVVVTGSYIKGTATDAALPVDVISAEDLAKQGSPSTLEIIKSLTVSNGVLGDTNQFDARAQGSEGTGTVNLRGFGPQRTLVLLNGRRLVNSPFLGAAAVDTNLIPSAAIGRVELLKDGAAATYGSDAIAGVVNFITRENFRGLDLSGDYKHVADTSGDYGAALAYGWGNDSVHFLVTGGYQHRSELLVRDRAFASRPFLENPQGGWSGAGNPSSYLPELGPAATPLVAVPVRDPQCGALGGYPGRTGAVVPLCYWQYSQFDALTEKEDRYQVYGEFNLNFANDGKWHTEAFFSGTEIPIYRTSPSYAALQIPTSIATGGTSPDAGGYYVPGTNPGFQAFVAANPGVLQSAGGTAADGARLIGYRPFAIGGNPLFGYNSSQGPRHYHAFRVSTGVNGNFTDTFGYDTAFTYMKQVNTRDARDTVVNRLELALRGLGGPNCTGATPGSAANSCFWFDPFSVAIPRNATKTNLVNTQYNANAVAGVNNDNLILDDWMFPKYGQRFTTDLRVFDGVLNGKMFKLPGGDAGWAAGVQYRKSNYTTSTDDIANLAITPCINSIGQGLTNIGVAGCTPAQAAAPSSALLFLGGASNVDLDQTVKAEFVEFSLPIVESLQLQIAGRHEDYGGQTGSTTDPKVAIRYQPIDALTFRASAGRTFRGPTQANVDPNTATSLQNIGGTFRAVRTSGNPALAPEKAKTLNFGAIVKVGGFHTSLDYWSFDFTNAIGVEPVANITGKFFSPFGALPDHCTDPAMAGLLARFTFNGACAVGSVIRLDVTTINGAPVKTSGLDYQVDFTTGLGGGDFGVGANATYILKYDVGSQSIAGVEVQTRQDVVGFLNYQTAAFPLPKVRGNLYAQYNIHGNNVRWQVNYIHHYEDQRLIEFSATSPTNVAEGAITGGKTIGSTVLHSLYYNVELPANTSLNLAVENIFNKDPSFARLDLDYDPFTGSPLGRTIKLSGRVKF